MPHEPDRVEENGRHTGLESGRCHVGVDGAGLLQRTGQVLHAAGRRTGRLHQRRG